MGPAPPSQAVFVEGSGFQFCCCCEDKEALALSHPGRQFSLQRAGWNLITCTVQGGVSCLAGPCPGNQFPVVPEETSQKY